MLKFFNSQFHSVTGAAIILSGATLISRLVGIVRDRLLAHYFGAGPVMDAYYTAFRIPDLIFNLLIAGALTAGFIPTFTKLLQANDNRAAAWRLTNNLINMAGLALIGLSILGIIFTRPLMSVLAPGLAAETLSLAAQLTRVMFLSPILLGISMIAGGVLQSLRRFTLYAIAPIFYNLGIIIGAAIFVSWWGPIGLAWGVILGATFHTSLQLYGARQNGWRWRWILDWRDIETRLVGKLMVPRTLGLAVVQVNQIVMTILASLLPTGSIAIYNYANDLQAVPLGIVAIPFAIAVFPLLSTAHARGEDDQFVEHLSSTIRQILFLIVPSLLLFLLLRAQIVRVVLGSGKFDWTATTATADTLAFFALGLMAQALIPLLARAFYALSDTKTPFVLGLIADLIGIIAALVLMKPLGVPGLALAATIGLSLNAAALLVALRLRMKTLDEGKILSSLFRLSVGGLLMGAVVQAAKYPLAKILNQDYFWGIFGQGLIAGLLGLAVYVSVCYMLRLPEAIELKESFARRWLTLKNLPTETLENKE